MIAPRACPAGVLGRHEPDKRHQSRRRREASWVAKFGGNRQRGQIVDATKTSQPLDARLQRLEREQRAQILLDRAEPSDRLVHGAQIRAMGLIEGGHRPRLGSQPRLVALRPRFLGAREAAAVPEENLRQPMTGAEEVPFDVLATAQQIAGRFFLLGRNVNGRERARSIQHRQLAGIAAIRLDAVTRAPRNQRGRDHVARDAAPLQVPLQLESTGSRFVATSHAAARPQAIYEAADRRQIGRQWMERRPFDALPAAQRPRPRRRADQTR